MTLTTHAIVGAAAASLLPTYPVVGFMLGFATHFAIDSIPHWSEGKLLRSVHRENGDPSSRKVSLKGLFHDVVLVGGDSLLGFLIAILILGLLFNVPLYLVLLGAFAGQMPDGLQFLYFIFKPKFMLPLQRFHSAIQTEYDNKAYLLIEAGLIVCVVSAGFLGVFVL